MNSHLWWYLARGAGITSWFFGATSVMTGLLLSSKATLKPRPNWQLDLHRYQGALSLSMLGLHLASLVADSYAHFGLREILVPAASTWKPLAVSWGVVAMYLLGAVQITSLLRKRIPPRIWRAVHLSSLLAYLLSTAHFWQAGTDHKRAAALLLVVAMTGINLALLSFRLLAAPRSRRTPTRASSAS
jgi:methionine sulfoxide reductase heme-binding subunit